LLRRFAPRNDENQFTELFNTTSISFAPGRLNASESFGFSSAGSVILMASTAAIETFFAPNAFNALKAALMTYSKQLSQAWGAKGIRVNVITPGPITFPGGNWTKIQAAAPDVYEATAQQGVFGRLGEADEVARTMVFLASPASSFTTGANFVIDGGYTKRVQF